VRVLVEAQCLTWIEVDIDEGYVSAVRIHAVPENLSLSMRPDVIAADPEQQQQVTDDVHERAISIATNSKLPMPFDLMV
jgi:hypothetical protein